MRKVSSTHATPPPPKSISPPPVHPCQSIEAHANGSGLKQKPNTVWAVIAGVHGCCI
jgi:hypothetical protein